MLTQKRNIALACALSGIAGFLDGIGFIYLGGLFVSFMSGNSTRLGVSLAGAEWFAAAEALGLIALFVAGATVGGLIVTGGSLVRQKWVLFAEGALLMAAALSQALGLSQFAVAAIVLAMGMENAVFQIEGGAGLGLTYVTGALVKVGQALAGALTGGPPFAFVPNALLWASLVGGGVLGTLAYWRIGLGATWIAAAMALGLGGLLALRDLRAAS